MISKAVAHQIMDTGILNECIKGYLISSCKNAGIKDCEQVKKLLNGLTWAFDDMTSQQAEQVYNKFPGCLYE